ncbi:hypothetical protein [Roseitranquillus sediminis]|uniref:hypothetical protein n=1 Tax=Roseitranquillus sediminis TaxID=2809051 RepID=UPI001D0CCAD4|nr:hypothetical protein [Roseitranquillus sediminis]MBM9593841.1 hypothetical protein [Roseitranquillus sediminis]
MFGDSLRSFRASISEAVLFRVLTVLVAIDAILILGYVGAGLYSMSASDRVIPPVLDLTLDWSAGEVFSYGKWAAAAVLLARAFRQTRIPLLLALAFMFAVLLADDMLMVHERLGAVLGAALDLDERIGLMRGQDLGEILVWGVLGTAVGLALAWGFLWTERRHWGVGAAFVGMLALLVLCGGVADMAAIAAIFALDGVPKAVVVGALHVIEDGGEMILASLGCAAAAACEAASRSVAETGGPARIG